MIFAKKVIFFARACLVCLEQIVVDDCKGVCHSECSEVK